jgi:hypothetical protein
VIQSQKWCSVDNRGAAAHRAEIARLGEHPIIITKNLKKLIS